jgi:hypothetical protein
MMCDYLWGIVRDEPTDRKPLSVATVAISIEILPVGKAHRQESTECGYPLGNVVSVPMPHHRVTSFQEEFRKLLRAHGVAYDERYVCD